MYKLKATITIKFNADPKNYGTNDINEIIEMEKKNLNKEYDMLSYLIEENGFELHIEEMKKQS